MPDDLVEEQWPVLAALERFLDGLDGRTVTVQRVETGNVDDLAERVARALSRPGGPQIAQRAIADR